MKMAARAALMPMFALWPASPRRRSMQCQRSPSENHGGERVLPSSAPPFRCPCVVMLVGSRLARLGCDGNDCFGSKAKAQTEQMFSSLLPITDVGEQCRHFQLVPAGDIATRLRAPLPQTAFKVSKWGSFRRRRLAPGLRAPRLLPAHIGIPWRRA